MLTSDLEARVRTWAEAQLPPDRLEHVRRMVDTATELAARYAPEEIPRVRLASWIHDVAKGWNDDDLLAYAESHDLPITEGDRATPMLLHGAVAYALASDRFGLSDCRLRSACALHTTGASGMSVTDKIVFVADLTEPTRDFDGVQMIRVLAHQELDAAVLAAAEYTIRHLLDRHRTIDPRGIALYNQLITAGVRYER